MNLLSEKVVIVTGASRGIGAAAARLIADEGASVVAAREDERALRAPVADMHRQQRGISGGRDRRH